MRIAGTQGRLSTLGTVDQGRPENGQQAEGTIPSTSTGLHLLVPSWRDNRIRKTWTARHSREELCANGDRGAAVELATVSKRRGITNWTEDC